LTRFSKDGMIKKSQLVWTTIGLGLIAVGLVLGWQPLMQTLHAPQPSSSSVSAAALTSVAAAPVTLNTNQPLIEGRPVRIQLPSLGIDLAVINGYYDAATQSWTLTNNDAQYAVNTVLANNQEGNTFIYGHNRKQVFESLYKIQPGQHAIVYTDNNHVFTYEYTGSVVTSPNDDSLFTYQGPPILTLQTCSGLWYQNRQLFHFSLVSVS
jgi:LPXTG-site transpeptidase (sortase) family protein